MNKLGFVTVAAVVLAASTALASAQAVKLPDGCTLVTVNQPTNAKRPDTPFTLRGEGADLVSIKLCNPEGATNVISVTPSPTAGARIVVRMKNNAGTVGLPSNYAAGEIHNNYCDIADGKVTFTLYQFDWSGGLKSSLPLKDHNELIAGKLDFYRRDCETRMPPALRAQLKG